MMQWEANEMRQGRLRGSSVGGEVNSPQATINRRLFTSGHRVARLVYAATPALVTAPFPCCKKPNLDLLFVILLVSASSITCSDRQKPLDDSKKKNFSETVRGFSAADTAIASRYFVQAEQLTKQSRFDSAVAYFEQAGKIYEAAQDWQRYIRSRNQMSEARLRQGEADVRPDELKQNLQLSVQHFGERTAEVATAYNNIGRLYYLTGALDSALAYCDKALSLQRAALGERHVEVARSYLLIGNIRSYNGEYDQAFAMLNKALSILPAASGEHALILADIYNAMAVTYDDLGDYDRAAAFYEKALTTLTAEVGERHPRAADIDNNVGTLYEIKGDYERALAYYQNAVSIYLRAGRKQHANLAYFYDNVANVYRSKGDYDEAAAFYQKALDIFLSTVGDQHPEATAVYNNLALLYAEKKDYDRSIFFQEKCLEIEKHIRGEQHDAVASSYNNLGAVYGQKGDYDRAIALHQKALAIRLRALGAMHPDVANIYKNLGKAYQKKGEDRQALLYHHKALAILRAAVGERHPEVAAQYNNLAGIYEAEGERDRALEFYQQAIIANVPMFADHDPYANPRLESILSENHLLETLARKAAAMADLYANQSHQLHDLEAAVSTYQLAGQLIDQMRSGYKAEGSKLFLAEKATDIYGHAIQSVLQIHAATRRDEHKGAAFLFAEKSKAGIMLDALSEAEAKQFAGIPDSLLQKERQLRIGLAFYDGKLTEEQLQSNAADSANLAHLQDKVFNLKQAYDALLQRFEKEYPDYYNLKYQVKTASVPEVQQFLDDRTALVEYFTGDDSIFIFAITKNNFAIKASANDSPFARQIEQLRQGIIKQDFVQYTQAAYRLYQTLLAPLKAGDQLNDKNLIIVPDAALSAIPFEVLLTEQVAAKGILQDYTQLPFLVNAHAVSYAYSATLLQQELQKKNRQTPRDYLAFAPVFANGLPAGTRGAEFFKENFAPAPTKTASATAAAAATRIRGYLPSTKKEVTAILDRFENSYNLFDRWFGNKAKAYWEGEANETKLKAGILGDYRILHFATHGLVNEKNPKLSGLLLAQEDSTSKEDGILHLGEIYNLNLNADLVVLSACETGLGQVAKGEGIIGLTRGFLYAGAANLLVSLWQVSDATTADLMVDFYDKMLGGMSKPEALREAKLQMIRRHPEYAKPYYWAPFILVGK
jgi:CHAT domain-containing protein/lipopolysaccharide biosynthesis regulator YciM